MKIGVNYPYPLKKYFGEKAGLTMLKNAGFDAVDYSLDVGFKPNVLPELTTDEDIFAFYEAVRRHMDEIGIIASQTHAPHGKSPVDDNGVPLPEEVEMYKRAIKVTAILGAPYIVIHPVTYGVLSSDYERGMRATKALYDQLTDTLVEYNVKLGVENMFTYDYTHYYYCSTSCSNGRDLMEHANMMNSDRYCVCLDIGHASVVGLDPVKVIRQVAPKLELVHVHDTYGPYDSHCIPGECSTKWPGVMRALKEVGFKGVFSMELAIFGKASKIDPSLMEDYAGIAAKVARFLVKEYFD